LKKKREVNAEHRSTCIGATRVTESIRKVVAVPPSERHPIIAPASSQKKGGALAILEGRRTNPGIAITTQRRIERTVRKERSINQPAKKKKRSKKGETAQDDWDALKDVDHRERRDRAQRGVGKRSRSQQRQKKRTEKAAPAEHWGQSSGLLRRREGKPGSCSRTALGKNRSGHAGSDVGGI